MIRMIAIKKNRFCCAILVILLSGCATTRNAVPVSLLNKAEIVGMSGIRAFADQSDRRFTESIIQSIRQESPPDFPLNEDGTRTYPILVISGGAANGAFGAGLLKGWTEEGSRPNFKIVTGISTGALTAPFAFLGSDYDQQLEEFFTTTSTNKIMKVRSLISLLFSNSLAKNDPLVKLISKEINKDILAAIAKEHAKGRRLYVATTNLDAQRLVVWDMGAIASIRSDRALQLFQNILLASSAIPAAFPPVYFNVEVEADGKTYNEMHVDGGALAQSFFIYGILKDFKALAKEANMGNTKRNLKMYVIRNGFITPVWQEVPDKLAPIMARSLDTMINAQGIGDLHRLYYVTKQGGGDFNLAYIPSDFIPDHQELFDVSEMNRLFDAGYEGAVNGYSWKKMPDIQ